MSNETGKPIQRRQTLSATLGQYKKEQIGIFPLYLYIFDYRNIEFEIFLSFLFPPNAMVNATKHVFWLLLLVQRTRLETFVNIYIQKSTALVLLETPWSTVILCSMNGIKLC